MHSSIKEALGYEKERNEQEILTDWKKCTKELCKPCWELHYCPYGPFVEEFPLLPILRDEAEAHNKYLKYCLETNTLASGKELNKDRKEWFLKNVKDFNKNDYPEQIPKILKEAACRVFGHLCPVFFVAEPLTETKERRKHSRSIPRDVMLKIVRRDGQICQKCHKPVPDDQVEFDHIIPYSKGGRSTTGNLRLVHRECNRRKSSSLDEILSENPIEHLWELQKQKKV